jgi:hypothetical protein
MGKSAANTELCGNAEVSVRCLLKAHEAPWTTTQHYGKNYTSPQPNRRNPENSNVVGGA